MKCYTKREINKMALVESKVCHVFEKKDLRLKEETNTNSYVEPSSSSASGANLAMDLNKAKTQNPHDEEFVVDASSYDGRSGTQDVTVDIKADNPQDASKKLQQTIKQPGMNSIVNKGNLKAKIHMGENIVKLSKSELNKILFN